MPANWMILKKEESFKGVLKIMNIIVLVKQVPNTTKITLDPRTGNLIREGLESIMNPDDLHALEAAVALKERTKGKVTAMTMGPPQAVDVLSQALGMGADNAILLSDRAFVGADTWTTSYTLSKGIEKIKDYDLVICCHQAIDGDTAQIGPWGASQRLRNAAHPAVRVLKRAKRTTP